MSTLTGTGALAKLAARRDRLMLPIWIYVITALVAGTAYSFRQLYPTPASRAEFAATAGHNPALLSLYGPLFGHSLGSLTAWRYGTFAALGAGLMSIFLVVRHTRGDEETGRLELIGSAAVGRHAALAAAIGIAIIANTTLALLMSAALIALGLPAGGSLALAVGIACCGLAFTAVAAVAAQLARPPGRRGGWRSACSGRPTWCAPRRLGGAAGPRWLTWLSPLGWTELIRAFGAIRWQVLALPLLTAVVVTAAACVLAVRRDYDAGLLAQRPGPARGAGWLSGPFALAWRLHRGALLGWTAGALICGVVVGSAAKGIGGLLGSGQVRRIIAELGGKTA